MNYFYHLGTLICIYSVLGISLNMTLGWGGMLSLAHGALYGMGAYAAAISATRLGIPFWMGLVLSMVAAAIPAWFISRVTLRLRGDYFILGTLAFQVMIVTVFNNWVEVTRGPYGIPGIPRPALAGVALDSPRSYFLMMLGFTASIFAIAAAILRSRFGLLLRALRDEEVVALSLGKDVAALKRRIFTLSGGLSGLAGAIYAHYLSYVDPTAFTLTESIFILTIVIVGGLESLVGTMAGVCLLLLLPEGLRLLDMPSAMAANLRQILYALCVIGCVYYRPRGLMGRVELR